jgi:hypothetical protein
MTDTEILDYLQAMNDRSSRGRRAILLEGPAAYGWRLRETNYQSGARRSVRQAVEDFAARPSSNASRGRRSSLKKEKT